MQIPSGYDLRTDPDTNSPFYVNVFTSVRWFSAEDEAGKVYFYEENGNESCWRLPSVSQSFQDDNHDDKNASAVVLRQRSVKKPLTGSTKRIADNYRSMQQQQQEGGSSGSEEVGSSSSLKRRASSNQAGEGSTKTEMLEKKFTLPVSTPSFQVGGFCASVEHLSRSSRWHVCTDTRTI